VNYPTDLKGLQVWHFQQRIPPQLADGFTLCWVPSTQLDLAKTARIAVRKVTGGACSLARARAEVQQQLVEAWWPASAVVWGTAVRKVVGTRSVREAQRSGRLMRCSANMTAAS
jgi:hypothetical protein